jgi:serine/threonine protein phosphatase 1
MIYSQPRSETGNGFMATGLTFVIPDLHGRFDLLKTAVARIVAYASGQAATVVTLGDYVDRGPDSNRIIESLMGWPPENLRLVALKGNHEEMMWRSCTELPDAGWWIANGGDRTLLSYGQDLAEQPKLRVIPGPHLDWIAQLPLLHVDKYRVYVHAAVDPARALNQQDHRVLLWKRYREGFDVGHGDRHVVHGHQAMARGPIVMKHRTNLDTMAWKTGRLIIGVFEDQKAGSAIEFIEIRGEPAP